jgi:peptide-methionine (R)-S-oxide reductase
MSDVKNMPESYWKEKLAPEQYKVVRQKGTERPFSGALYNNHDVGMYECVACGQSLFSSDAKFESGTDGQVLTGQLTVNTLNCM